MKKVITYGTFDLFHLGHVNLLKRARALGDQLIVGLSTDEFNQQKGKTTLVPYSHRLEILKACRYVDKVIPENDWEQKPQDLLDNQINIFVIGDDWQGKFDHLKEHCQVVYLPRTAEISSTAMKDAIEVFIQLKKNFI